MALKDEICKLIELQQVDGEIYKLRRAKETEFPALLKQYNDELQRYRTVFEQAENELKQAQLLKKEKELDLAAKEEAVQKAQGALYQLKNNKDYQAKLNEISSLKADISIYEEDVLKTIETIEQTQTKVQEASSVFNEHKSVIEEKIAKVNSEIADIDAKINALKDKSSIARNSIDAEILTKYERLLDKRDGTAISSVVNGSCTQCHIHTNHQKINAIKMYNELVLCDTCNRILYLPEDFEK